MLLDTYIFETLENLQKKFVVDPILLIQEAVIGKSSAKYVFLKIFLDSQGSTYEIFKGVYFVDLLRASASVIHSVVCGVLLKIDITGDISNIAAFT